MRLKVLLPTRVLVDEEIDRLTAEGHDGLFTILPRHVDFVSTLVTGILSYRPVGATEDAYTAVDRGILVKRGADVLVSTRRGAHSDDLDHLAQNVLAELYRLDKQERQTRTALARLEANFIQRFVELD